MFKTPAPSSTPNAFGESWEKKKELLGTGGILQLMIRYVDAKALVTRCSSSYTWIMVAANSILGNPDMSAAKGEFIY